MIKRLAVLLVLAAITGCGGGDGRPESVPNVDGLWRESAATTSRTDCSGFTVPPVTACDRPQLQHDDQTAWVSSCGNGDSLQGLIGFNGRVDMSESNSLQGAGSCSIAVQTDISYSACDLGANNSSETAVTRVVKFSPSEADCPLPATCVAGSGRGRACASNADCGTNGRCNSAATCIGGENDNDACTDSAGCPGGSCSVPFCEGGANAGGACSSDADCLDGACVRPVCIGGTDDGQACVEQADCPGGNCNSKIRDCTVVFASSLTRRPGLCVGGASDGNNCTSNTDCRPGSCVTTVCGGGARDGLGCAADAGCPPRCSGATCDGGPRTGQTCSADAECPFFECSLATPALTFCTAGLNNRLACSSNSDCPCENPTDQSTCPANRCVAGASCVGGLRQGESCTTSAECTVFTCGSSVCEVSGEPCQSDIDCGTDRCIDRPFCSGGGRNGKTCSNDGDCLGGTCTKQARPCSNDSKVD